MALALRQPNALVPALLRYLAVRGEDVAELALRFDLPPDAGDYESVNVTTTVVSELVTTASDLLGEPALALRLPAELPWRRYDVVELALRASGSLRAGLVTAARYAALVHPALACELDDTDLAAPPRWIQRTPSSPRGLGPHLDLYALAFVLVHARAGLAAPLPATHVWLAHARPRALEPLEAFFGTDRLEFGAPDSGFAFAREALDAPLHGDPRLLATVEALAAAPPRPALAARVAAHVRTDATAGAAEIARALGTSARSLQRHLEAEGTTLSAVVDATRERRARELLADDARSLAEIADACGFSDLATFSRAFKRWTGQPPGQFRRYAARR